MINIDQQWSTVINIDQQWSILIRNFLYQSLRLCFKTTIMPIPDQYGSVLINIDLYWSISGRWQAPAAVLPEGPKDQGESHSRARRAREWLKPASPRARRARGRAKPSACFGACQCYYMFFTIQPKIAIFVAQFKYLNDGQYDWKFQQSFILTK